MRMLRKYSPTRSTIAAAAFVAMTSIGLVVGTAGTASAANPACGDFFKILVYYAEIGDQATARALFDNMVDMGC
jgi:hypothetical protein